MEIPFPARGSTDGQLRGDQHQRAFRLVRQTAAQFLQDKFHVGFVVIVDGRVVGEPENVRVGAGGFRVVGEAQIFLRETGGEEFVKARLEQRRFAFIEPRDVGGVEVEAGHGEMFRAAGRINTTEMPESDDGDFHGRSAETMQ